MTLQGFVVDDKWRMRPRVSKTTHTGSEEVVNMVLDGMDDALENAYESRSIRVYMLDTATGNIVYKSGKGPYSIPAKINDIAALQL